ALLCQPLDRLFTIFLLSARAKNNLNSRPIKDITQAHHRVDRFVLRHSLKKSLPILRLIPHMMNPLGNICERSVDVENDNFVNQRSLLNTVIKTSPFGSRQNKLWWGDI